MLPFKRVMLKLSGEVLAGGIGDKKSSILDFEAVRRIGLEVAAVRASGLEVCLVVGGGNILRGKETEKLGIERAQADYMGMLGTIINALALQSVLEQSGVETRVQTAIEMRAIAEPYIRRRAIHHLEKGRIVIFAAGTGSPYFSTDTTAALRAAEMSVDCMIKGTKVDGIYDDDPKKNTAAKLLPDVTYKDALTRSLNVMDGAAFSLCMENKIPIFVVNIEKPGNLFSLLVKGVKIGTIVHNGQAKIF
jgi:uridylate kinase